MASIRKLTRPNGSRFYQVRWRTPDGKHRTKGGFATKTAAEDYAREVEFASRRGTLFDPKAGEVTFRAAARDWLNSRHDLKPRTRAGYEYALAPSGRELSIDAVFGGYPLNAITRVAISEWVSRLAAVGKKPSTVKHAYFLVRMVLAQAVADGRLSTNPADYVRTPTERNNYGIVDDPTQFLSAAQVSALEDATPWPYNVLVHVAAWAGLRAAELGGLQVGDVDFGRRCLKVERTVMVIDGKVGYDTPKTRGSRRRVPLTPATVELLRGYLAEHPHRANPSAPLFPAFKLIAQKPTGKKSIITAEAALAALAVGEAEARLDLDWYAPLRHPSFYKAVYRPAVFRAGNLPPELTFHALRHTYASLCVAAGLPALEISRFMGHAKVTTTLSVYTHLFEDDFSDAMSALGALGSPRGANVVPLRGVG